MSNNPNSSVIIQDYLQQAFNEHPAFKGRVLTRYVLVAEMMNEQGIRELHVMWPNEITEWEKLGMLQYALDGEEAETMWEDLEVDPDDE